MAIVGSILKVIGMIILLIVCVLLAVLLTVLFVPARYRVRFRTPASEGGETDEDGVGSILSVMEGRLHITWLLYLLHFDASLSAEGWHIRFKVLNFTLIERGNGTKRTSGAANAMYGADEGKASSTQYHSGKMSQAGPEEYISDVRSEKHGRSEQSCREISYGSGTDSKEMSGEGKTSERTNHVKHGRRSARSRFYHMGQAAAQLYSHVVQIVSEAPEKLTDFVQAVFEAADKGMDAADAFISGLEKAFDGMERTIQCYLDDDAVCWYRRVIRQLSLVLRHWKVRCASGRLAFGTGSPDTTALLYGLVCRCLPAGERMQIEPDLYEAGFEADMKIGGHIRLIHLVKAAVCLLLDRQTMEMIRRVRKGRGGD